MRSSGWRSQFFLHYVHSARAVILLFGNRIAAGWLGDIRCAKAFPFVLLCLTLTGVENIFKSLFIGLEQMQFTAYSEVGEQLIRILSVGILLYEYQGEDYGTIAMLIFAGMVVSEVFSALFLTRLFQKNIAAGQRAGRLDAETSKQFFFYRVAAFRIGFGRQYHQLGRFGPASAAADGGRTDL